VYGNPNYQSGGREASIVVNEVSGSRRTNLLGVTEMFGRGAEFVLINPNGIYVNGAGFINMPRVTLGTGKGVYSADGAFIGMEVMGKGSSAYAMELNAEGSGYSKAVGSAINVNGPLVMEAGKDITIKGSEVIAAGEIEITAGGKVTIDTALEKSETTHKETTGEVTLSAGISHSAASVYNAGKELNQAKNLLIDAEKAYENYR
jgi:filamentous hemagglutinin family protein